MPLEKGGGLIVMAKWVLSVAFVLAGTSSFASTPATTFVENTADALRADDTTCPPLLTDGFAGTFKLLCFTTEPWTFDEFHQRFLWAADFSAEMRPHGQWIVQDTPSGEILYLVVASSTDAALVMYDNNSSRYAGALMFLIGELERLEDGPLGLMASTNATSPLDQLAPFEADDYTFEFVIRGGTYVESGERCQPSSVACGLQLAGLEATDVIERMELDAYGWRVSTVQGQRVHATIAEAFGIAISESDRGVGIVVFRYPSGTSGGPVVRAP